MSGFYFLLYHPASPNPKDPHTHTATHRIVFLQPRDGMIRVHFHYWQPEKMIWCLLADTDINLVPTISMVPDEIRDEIVAAMNLTDIGIAKKWWDAFRSNGWVRGS